jgi:hypothetical protein
VGGFIGVAADSTGNPIGVGYAGDGGFFVRSTDGGATWSRTLIVDFAYPVWNSTGWPLRAT